MHTITDVIALAKASAHTAADQWQAFDDSNGAHLINLYDTLVEHRTTLERGIRKSFGEILKIGMDAFNNEVALIAKGQ
jgi:hypothetical protein